MAKDLIISEPIRYQVLMQLYKISILLLNAQILILDNSGDKIKSDVVRPQVAAAPAGHGGGV